MLQTKPPPPNTCSQQHLQTQTSSVNKLRVQNHHDTFPLFHHRSSDRYSTNGCRPRKFLSHNTGGKEAHQHQRHGNCLCAVATHKQPASGASARLSLTLGIADGRFMGLLHHQHDNHTRATAREHEAQGPD